MHTFGNISQCYVNTASLHLLKISIQINLDNTMANSSKVLLLGTTRPAMEYQK